METVQKEIGILAEDLYVPKLPFRRLRLPLIQIVNTAIPLHIQLLNQHSQNLDVLAKANATLELRLEQVKASKTVHLLKQDIFELEKVNLQVRDEDEEDFQKMIRTPIRDAVNVLSEFMSIHTDILGPLQEDVDLSPPPLLVCHLDQSSADNEQQLLETKQQLEDELRPGVSENWSFLRRELLEIHSLMRKFSVLVFHQQEKVDTIQSNIGQTQVNTQVGKEYLKKASMLKAAAFPFAGAFLGGLTLGPIGAIAGFKLMGCMACMAGGSVFGYSMGMKLKTKQQASSGIEMKALTYTSKRVSTSMPNLCDETESKKDS